MGSTILARGPGLRHGRNLKISGTTRHSQAWALPPVPKAREQARPGPYAGSHHNEYGGTVQSKVNTSSTELEE